MIPKSLRLWFTSHFIIDLVAAVPLFFAPRFVFTLIGLPHGEPLFARLIAAAFFAIGTTSLIMRDGGVESYRALLDLKIIWSSLALVGISWSLYEGAPTVAWSAFGIFIVFWAAWIYYRRQLVSWPHP